MLKQQRQDMWREINRLKELNEQRVKESADQGDKLKAIDYDLSRTQGRIDDTQKIIDARNYDLRNKQLLLEDSDKEIARVKDNNSRIATDNSILRRDIDKVSNEAYDLRKEGDYQ
jgi:chromosome segregation ATPase